MQINLKKTPSQIHEKSKNDKQKWTYSGHVVLQQLCSSGAELSFTRRLRLR